MSDDSFTCFHTVSHHDLEQTASLGFGFLLHDLKTLLTALGIPEVVRKADLENKSEKILSTTKVTRACGVITSHKNDIIQTKEWIRPKASVSNLEWTPY